MFQATLRDKRGSIRDTAFAPDDAEAAKIIFDRNLRAESVQICNAYFDENGRPRGNGNNIHWIQRRDIVCR